MDYRLAILTHGDHLADFTQTVASFAAHALEGPADVYVVADAPRHRTAAYNAVVERELGVRPFTFASDVLMGCCRSSAALWVGARQTPHPHVFWLEHDFLFLRPFSVLDMAFLLDSNPQLAQVALVRQPVGGEGPGGFVGDAPGWYHARSAALIPWLEHRRNWTLNPCLISRYFMDAHDWPAGVGCEHEFAGLLPDDVRFGLMGDGEPWCHHFGVHDGIGY